VPGLASSYEIHTLSRDGHDHARRYLSEDALGPGSIVVLGGRYWLVERVEAERADAKPARYRLTLRHPDGRQEAGSFRRFHADAPRVGHQLTTLEDGAPISWQVVEERLAFDDEGEPFLESIAERDYAEVESLPDHQLEHALERDDEDGTAADVLTRAEAAGQAVELVALEAGQAPDWDEADRFLDALVLDEIGDNLLELCGVHPGRDPREHWLDLVKARLRDDLQSFRADVGGDHDEIEEWEFRGGRIFAAVGHVDDDSNPLSGYGWMCRLVDSNVIGAAGFTRVRKAVMLP
jgi:hypothetical protein